MQTNSGKSPVHPFMNSSVLHALSMSVTETLKIMAKTEAKIGKAYVEKNWKSPTAISAVVALRSPPYQGQVRFHFTDATIALLCKAILAEDVDPESAQALDCAGEFSNMFFSFSKTKLNEIGYNFKLSIPLPFRSAETPEVISDFSHVIIPFQVHQETCFIQIVVL